MTGKSWLGHGRAAEFRDRRCTATAHHTGKRCGLAPSPGSNVCKWHGRSDKAKNAAAWRLEIAEALRDGIPHPAYVFFELMNMRWSLSADGTEVTCSVPVSEVGSLEDFREGFTWVRHWEKTMTYVRYRSAEVERKKRVRQSDKPEASK